MSPLSPEARQRLLAAGTRGRTGSSVAEQLKAQPTANPLEGVQYSGDLQADLAAECQAMLDGFDAAAAVDPPEWQHTSRSGHWVAVVFLVREDKEHFLIAARLFEAGDKYVAVEDWDSALATLAADGPAVPDVKRWRMPTWTTNTDGEPITESQLKFRQAAANAARNFALLGDSEYWFCVCFRTAEQRAAFLIEHPSVPGTAYLDGYVVAESLGISIPVEEV